MPPYLDVFSCPILYPGYYSLQVCTRQCVLLLEGVRHHLHYPLALSYIATFFYFLTYIPPQHTTYLSSYGILIIDLILSIEIIVIWNEIWGVT